MVRLFGMMCMLSWFVLNMILLYVVYYVCVIDFDGCGNVVWLLLIVICFGGYVVVDSIGVL